MSRAVVSISQNTASNWLLFWLLLCVDNQLENTKYVLKTIMRYIEIDSSTLSTLCLVLCPNIKPTQIHSPKYYVLSPVRFVAWSLTLCAVPKNYLKKL